MVSATQLAITGYGNQPVPHTFLKQDHDTDHLAILLPGMGYNTHMPLFYYSTQILISTGANILRLEYDYRQTDFRSLSFDEQQHWLFSDAAASFLAANADKNYQQITLIGKSLGTLSMGHLLTTEILPAKINAVWLTPLIQNEKLRQKFLQFGKPSYIAIGTADPYYDAEILADLQIATGSQIVSIEDADHSLNITEDVPGSIQVLHQVLHTLEDFLAR